MPDHNTILIALSFQVLYTEGKTVHLMDPDTFDQKQVDQALFGDSQKWLESPNLTVSLQFYEEQPLAGEELYSDQQASKTLSVHLRFHLSARN